MDNAGIPSLHNFGHNVVICEDRTAINPAYDTFLLQKAQVFSTLIAYGYQADVSLRYLCGKKKWTSWIGRPLLLAGIFLGGVVNGQVVWSMGDTGAGLMAWTNLLAIVLLAPMAFKILKDYENQRKAGLNPMFDPATVGIDDPNGVWSEWVEKKKARGDYENPVLGYNTNHSKK